jgi:hypothetical protein
MPQLLLLGLLLLARAVRNIDVACWVLGVAVVYGVMSCQPMGLDWRSYVRYLSEKRCTRPRLMLGTGLYHGQLAAVMRNIHT